MHKLFLLSCLAGSMASQVALAGPWTCKKSLPAQVEGERYIVPQKCTYASLDAAAFRQELLQAPSESDFRLHANNKIIELPMPEGGMQRFRIASAPVMEQPLAARYPGIQTYLAQGVDNPVLHGRLDFTYTGFHAMLIGNEGTVFIDPLTNHTETEYQVYYKHDYFNPAKSHFACETAADGHEFAEPKAAQSAIGSELRTYRLALACTGEYASFSGGNVTSVLSAMVTSVNRVTGVYESEVDVRLVLVANNDTLIFLNASTDPYTNNNGSTMLGQNQTTVSARIGSANYDIGHVFSTGGGGIAQLGCVCSSSSKARGVTGSPSPVGDAYDIDYVAHEMGHQYGGNHTFNSTLGSCGGGNRNASTAWEPGSGITIMAYAGICSSDDVAPHSIAYFHTGSFDEVVAFTTTGNGNSCAIVTQTGNTAPVIAPMTTTYSIPYLCGVKLSGTATDANNDTLTYSWEEFDTGTAGAWNTPSGNAPIFRSYNPYTTGVRYCPSVTNVMNNTFPIGELRPTYARTLKFRLTVRDNRAGGSGVVHVATPVTATVVNVTDTFKITYPNTTGISWPSLSMQTITWNVASTIAAPINCPTVDIYLSTNTGSTFPVLLGDNVPNTGSYTFTVPGNVSNTCRLMILGHGNIFYDVNDKNFAITQGTAGIASLNCAGATVTGTLLGNAPVSGVSFSVGYTGGQSGSYAAQNIASTGITGLTATLPAGNFANGSGTLTFSVSGTPSGIGVASFPLNIGGQTCSVTITINDAVGFAKAAADASLRLYPNPSDGNFFLECENAYNGKLQIEVMDLLGNTVYRTEAVKAARRHTQALAISWLAGGQYVIKVYGQGLLLQEKFIRE